MLPLRLTLENFMPYRGRQAPLVLEGLGVACLAGENGAGKSSLLDALTWALWGRSRAGAAADPLVAAGASEMAVELEFRVGEGPSTSLRTGRYRVIRRHRKSRGGSRSSGQTALELQSWDGEAYRSLSGTSVRETQQRLIELLRLDYDTFINTAFLLQGRADLFTLKPPAERKRLLGDILGLSAYDALADRARDEAREWEARRRAAALTGESLDRELATEPEVRSQLENSSTSLAALRPQLDAAEGERQRLESEVARLKELEAERDRRREETTRLEGEIARLEARSAEASRLVETAQAVVARRAEIEAGYEALEAARDSLNAQGDSARRHALLTERRAPLESAVREARSSLEREVAALESQVEALQHQGERASSLAAERAAVEARRTEVDAAREEHVARAGRLSSLVGEVEARRARILRLREEAQEIEQRVALLGEDVEGRCPLCGSDLGSHGMEQVREHYRQRREEIAAEVETITIQGRALQEERRSLEERGQQDEARLRQETAALDGAIGRLRGEEERAQQALRDLGPARERLAEARGRLQAGAFAEEEQAALAELDAEIAAVGYDPDAHQAASAHVAELSHWDEEHRLLQQVAAALPRDQAAVAEIAESLARSESLLAETAARLSDLTEALQTVPATEAQHADARTRAAALRQRVEAQEREETLLRLRLEEIERRREERRRLRTDERRSSDEKSIYEELAAAFGVRGVQALLIETALPELEEEANVLLARMTDNRMHLSLVTQRETRAGSQQETLEVLIGDEWGTRAYELYSGGEAFRINFALRIALSKLLARRAGAEVPLLFIDEGFGTQDATGRDRLVEAISALWEDPAFHEGLILVITHLEEIKTQFDVRIEVTKTEQGSRFQVVS